jgi:hypothetical protein
MFTTQAHSPAGRFHVDVTGGPVKMSRNELVP